MAAAEEIENAIRRGERFLADEQAELARNSFKLALEILTEHSRRAQRAGKIGGGGIGAAVVALLDALADGEVDHPILSPVLGLGLGVFAGRKVGELYSGTLAPLRVRAYSGLGDSYRLGGDARKARENYAAALNLAPHHAPTLRRLAELA